MPSNAQFAIGKLITDEQQRDAIHMAVAPVFAAERLAPGQHVGFIGSGEVGGGAVKLLGIVDPFLPSPVFKGDKFWMFLYPNSITSLRHDWEHPDFFKDAYGGFKSNKSYPVEEGRLRIFADEAGITYERLLEGAEDFVENGNYMVDGGRWEGFDIYDSFWDDYEKVTGKKRSDKKWGFFSCAC